MKHFLYWDLFTSSFIQGWFYPPPSPFKISPFSKWPNKIYKGGLRTWNFLGYWRKIILKFLGSTEKEVQFSGWSKGVRQFYIISKSKALFCPEFTRVKVEFLGGRSRKIHVEFSWVSVFDLGISKGKERFVLFTFSKGKVANLKDPGFFFKKLCP